MLKHGGDSALYSNESYIHTLNDGSLYLSQNSRGERASRQQMFDYLGKGWMLRCNIYALDFDLTSAKYAKKRLGKLISKPAPGATRGGVSDDKHSLFIGENRGAATPLRQAE